MHTVVSCNAVTVPIVPLLPRITDDDALAANWSDIIADTSTADPKPKVQYQVSKQSSKFTNPAVTGKTATRCFSRRNFSHCSSIIHCRCCSNQAAHALDTPNFMKHLWEAVNKLGGSERATPKGVLKLMKVDHLTIYHVKSHMQKYRTARYKPESSEAASSEKKQSAIDDFPSLDLKAGIEITEALRLQMEVQKRLHGNGIPICS
nr:protein PHR1-LIKE 1-like isoform X1 [Ipomoea batatas]